MTAVAYYLQCPSDIVRPVTREALIGHVNSAFSNASGRYRASCVEAETRYFRPLGISFERGVMVVTVDVVRVDGRQLEAVDFVSLDSFAFGAMKAATGRGWSVQEIRRRLAPVGTSEDTFAFGEVQEVKRIVGGTCNPATIQGPALSSQVVVSGATPGATRGAAPLIPPGLADNVPLSYKVAGAVVVVGVGAIAVAYVWRAFK